MSNRFVDNVTPLNATTLNQFEDDLKAYADGNSGQALYVHNVQILQGTGDTCMIGLITVYTHSPDPINTASKLASALGITGGVVNIEMGGRYDYLGGSYRYYNLTSAAFVSVNAITLRGYRIGFSDSSTGIVTYLDGSGTVTVSDIVSQVS